MDDRGRLIPFKPPIPSPQPSATPDAPPTFDVFAYQGYAVVSGPLFNIILLALQQKDPETFKMVTTLLESDHIE